MSYNLLLTFIAFIIKIKSKYIPTIINTTIFVKIISDKINPIIPAVKVKIIVIKLLLRAIKFFTLLSIVQLYHIIIKILQTATIQTNKTKKTIIYSKI